LGICVPSARRAPSSIVGSKFASTSSEGAKKTCLYDFHCAHGGKMVDFAGYLLPAQYKDLGIGPSHHHTRNHCSIFDVSHMLQTRVYGRDRIQFMEEICTADVAGLKEGSASLTVFTNNQGGIVDDLIVTKADDSHLYVVSNAGCRHKDIPLMTSKLEHMKSLGKDVTLEFGDDSFGLIAVQGPEAAAVVAAAAPSIDMSKLAFMTSVVARVGDVEGCRITRCGYTGEDGVEISVPLGHTQRITQLLLESKAGQVRMAGLGARDSLRLEAGLCLYGNDIDETTTPVEAGLIWTVAKARRTSGRDTFPGSAVILDQIKNKTHTRKRVGVVCLGGQGPPARAHAQVIHPQTGEKIGEVTSGCPSPSMEVVEKAKINFDKKGPQPPKSYNICMAYVPKSMAKIGTQVHLQVRNKTMEATVAKMPFVPTNYYTGAN